MLRGEGAIECRPDTSCEISLIVGAIDIGGRIQEIEVL